MDIRIDEIALWHSILRKQMKFRVSELQGGVAGIWMLSVMLSSVAVAAATGGRADAERAEQEQQLLRRVDSEQRQDGCLRHPAARSEDGRHLHWQQHRHPGSD